MSLSKIIQLTNENDFNSCYEGETKKLDNSSKELKRAISTAHQFVHIGIETLNIMEDQTQQLLHMKTKVRKKF